MEMCAGPPPVSAITSISHRCLLTLFKMKSCQKPENKSVLEMGKREPALTLLPLLISRSSKLKLLLVNGTELHIDAMRW